MGGQLQGAEGGTPCFLGVTSRHWWKSNRNLLGWGTSADKELRIRSAASVGPGVAAAAVGRSEQLPAREPRAAPELLRAGKPASLHRLLESIAWVGLKASVKHRLK